MYTPPLPFGFNSLVNRIQRKTFSVAFTSSTVFASTEAQCIVTQKHCCVKTHAVLTFAVSSVMSSFNQSIKVAFVAEQLQGIVNRKKVVQIMLSRNDPRKAKS